MIFFHNTGKLAFYIILVLSSYSLLPNQSSIADIFATSQKHTGHDSIVTTTGEATIILSGYNNAITNTKQILANGKTNSLINNTLSENSKVVILTFGDTEKTQFTTAKPILD